MTTKNVKSIIGTVTEGIKKGSMAVGQIRCITQGTAADFMTEQQYTKRQCTADEPFVEIEIAVEGITVTRTMKDYTRVGAGGVPPNSNLGKLLAAYDLAEDADINMIAKELTGKDGSSFCLWDIVV